MLLSYLYWDPNPALFNFNLPLLNRPILWYGFLFALGFFLAYGVLVYLLRRYFLFFPEFRKEDVLSWADLIPGWKAGMVISEAMKQEVVDRLNERLKGGEEDSRLLRFAKERVSLETFAKLQGRFRLEKQLGGVVLSINRHASVVAERITLYMILGGLIGARLGDVLVYQSWEGIVRNPMSIVAVWQGGLASHGGAVGILIALGLLARKRIFSFWKLLDFVAIPTAIAAVFIRIGNFFNQEILGTPSSLPWAVIFVHPAAGESAVPRHPVQLYEALWYLGVFVFLYFYWRSHARLKKEGRLIGFFLVLVFGFRFFIEFVKVEQSVHLSSGLTMGQYLSVPFIILGLWLLKRRGLSHISTQ